MTDNQEYPVEAVRVAEAWLSAQSVPAGSRVATSLDSLVRYLSGALEPGDAEAVETDLVSNPAQRQLFRETLTTLDRLRRSLWDEVVRAATEPGLAGQVAACWVAVASENSDALVTQGTPRAALAALHAFLRQVRLALATPRLATVRGPEDTEPTIVGELPAGTTLKILTAEIESDGSLVVRARLEGNAPDETTAQLAVAIGGQMWPIASTTFTRGEGEWRVPSIGQASGLPEGIFPSGMLAIAVGSQIEPVAMDVVELLGEVVGGPPVWLELRGPAECIAGQVHVTIDIPTAVRTAYGGHVLELDLMVSPATWQRLTSRPVQDWESGPISIVAPCPLGPEDREISPSLLRARLRPPM